MTAETKIADRCRKLLSGRIVPFVLALICLSLAPLTAASEAFVPSGSTYFLVAVLWWDAICLLCCLLMKRSAAVPVVMGFCALFLAIGWAFLRYAAANRAFLLGIFGGMLLGAIALGLYLQDRLTERAWVLLLLAAGILLRIVYVLCTAYYVRQHDVCSFGDGDGHAGYIEYLYNTGALPNMDVRTVYQFYHPPLHHILCALWMRLLTLCGMAYETACECIQILPLYYSMLILWISYRLFQAFSLRGMRLFVPLAIVSFHPTFFLLAGSVNNDTLSIAFALGAILCAVRWYRAQTFGNILKIALCIGLGMSTKLSVYMVAPAVAVLFLLVLLKNKTNLGDRIFQFASFGVVCLPLGLWWSIRNLLSHGVPPTYVPKLSEEAAQYVGMHPVWERLFSFGNGQLASVYEQFEFYDGAYFEYNPTLGILKTSMFGELINDVYFPSIRIWGIMLFWCGTVLAVWALVSLILALIRRNPAESPLRWLFGLLFATYLVMFYCFCFSYPHTCTMDARYIAPLIPLGALFIGLNFPKAKWLRGILYGITADFCISAAAVYLIVAL